MRRLFFLILFVLTIGVACGQVLYSVNGRDMKEESYILVVDNMLPVSRLIGVKDVFKCYNRSDVVITEYVGNDSWDKLKSVVESSFRLSTVINYKDIPMVDSVLMADCKVRLATVERLKPAAIRMLWENEIYRSLYERGDDDMVMDSYFQQVALLEGKRIVALDDTVNVFDNISESLDEQACRMVRDFRNGRDSLVKRYHRADSLYTARDMQGLAELQMEGMTELQKVNEIDDKVEVWCDRIATLMSKDRSFLIIHAKYLRGNLIERLKKKRLKIKEVKQ